MKYSFMRFPGGKPKAVTFSYDDGCEHDKRFIETINKYGIKCTFNLVGSRVEENTPLSCDYIKENIIEKGHEIAVHGYFHRAQDTLRPIEGIRDVLDSRLLLESKFGMIIRGMAYPDRRVDRFAKPEVYERVKSILSELDIAYARTVGADNDRFEMPTEWLNWVPTAHHKNPDVMTYIEKFINTDLSKMYIASRSSKLFYLWGHSFEFDRDGNWNLLSDICEKLSGHDDIWYATNIEIYNYTKAYDSLIYSADGTMIYNPTTTTLWFDTDGKLYSVKPDETIKLL